MRTVHQTAGIIFVCTCVLCLAVCFAAAHRVCIMRGLDRRRGAHDGTHGILCLSWATYTLMAVKIKKRITRMFFRKKSVMESLLVWRPTVGHILHLTDQIIITEFVLRNVVYKI